MLRPAESELRSDAEGVPEHIVSLYYRTAWLMFTKLGRDVVSMALHMYLGVSARCAQGRIQGGAK